MMPRRRVSSLVRTGSAVALVLVLAGCTKGGQFDPTEIFNSDMFESKKKLQGEREPVFPNGVPGADTGVPPDLVKGYQPPPDQAAADTTAAPDAAAAEAAQPKPKPKPKPKVARAPAQPQPQDPAFSQKPGQPPTRISIAPAAKQTPAAQQGGGTSQSVWPASPQAAPAQQTAQPGQSVWPNPPAPGTASH